MSVIAFKGSFAEMARPNRFRVSGFGLGFELPFMARATTLPGATIGTTEAWHKGRATKLAGDRVYPDWTLTVYQSTTGSILRAFQDWQEDALTHASNIGAPAHQIYKRDGYVELLDRTDVPVAKFQLFGAVPIELGAMDLASDSNDTPAEFTVTLAYDYFEQLI